MDFGGLSQEASDPAKSRKMSKIKSSVGIPQSPNYGSGEQKRFCRPQCFQRSQSLCSTFLQLSADFLQLISDLSQAVGEKRRELPEMSPKAHPMEQVNKFEPGTLSHCNGLQIRCFEKPTKSLEKLQFVESLLFQISRYKKWDPD